MSCNGTWLEYWQILLKNRLNRLNNSLNYINNFPSWLEASRDALEAIANRGRIPHAILIHGPDGTGRRLLALWTIGRVLDSDDFTMDADNNIGRILDADHVPSHPDFQLVQPQQDKEKEKEKRTISIDQIRSLISFLNLTSHQSGAKAALISPAQALTVQAGNSLLKTLEEPPGDSLIVLVTDSLSRIAPTVVSRCHRIRITTPNTAAATRWLRGHRGDVDWKTALELAGGAPFKALELHESGFTQQAAEFEQDLLALLDKRVTPAVVAKRWSRQDQDRYLRWLYQRVSGEIRQSVIGDGSNGNQIPQYRYLQIRPKTLNIERSFGCLRDINELRRLQGAGLNADLQLTDLLTRWYGGGGL
jgi:DNA polymerase-3 subunit delta'